MLEMLVCSHQCLGGATTIFESIQHHANGCENCEPCKLCGEGRIKKSEMKAHREACHSIKSALEGVERRKRIGEILDTMKKAG